MCAAHTPSSMQRAFKATATKTVSNVLVLDNASAEPATSVPLLWTVLQRNRVIFLSRRSTFLLAWIGELNALPILPLFMLHSISSYGFFTVASHDRLVSLPSAPLHRRLSTVSAGPKTAPSQAMSVTSLPPPSSPGKEAERIAKWGRMMQVSSRDRGGNAESWGVKASKAHKLRRRVYKGIPDRWRSAAWEVLMNNFSESGHDEVFKLGERYRLDIEKPSNYDIQIDLDVPRTISGHVLFRTRYGLG